jgi:CHRD domain
MPSAKAWFAMVAIAVLVAACGGDTAETPSPSPSTSAKPSGSTAPTATFKLSPAGSGVNANGTMAVFARESSMTVELKITGLQAGSSHISHIHTGACPLSQRGSIAFALNQVIADGQGNADVRTTLSVKFPPSSGHWYVVVHAGPDMQASNAGYLLCGNLF